MRHIIVCHPKTEQQASQASMPKMPPRANWLKSSIERARPIETISIVFCVLFSAVWESSAFGRGRFHGIQRNIIIVILELRREKKQIWNH